MFATISRKQMFQVIAMTLCIFAFVGMVMLTTTTAAFCDDAKDVANTITNAFSKITENVYGIMKAVIVPCCIVALAFAGFQFLIGGQQGAEKARKVIIAVACALAFIIFAPIVVKAITSIVKSGNGQDGASWDDFNPLKPIS